MLTSPNQGAIPEPEKPEAHTQADSREAEVGGLSKMPCAFLPWQLRAKKAGSLLEKKGCLLLGVLCRSSVVACVAFCSDLYLNKMQSDLHLTGAVLSHLYD